MTQAADATAPADNGVAQKPETVSRFAEVMEAHRGETHAIVLHNYPDPDALASAYAHQLISAAYDIETDILYTGKISHPQNVALVRVLGLTLTLYRDGLDLSRYAGAVFLDNQGTSSVEIVRALEDAGAPPLLVVDHHEPQLRLEPAFRDVRRTGATATIYAEYLEHGPPTLEKNRREHVLAATALLHGILTDTDGLIGAGENDFHAVAFLSRFRDAELLKQIMTQARSKQTMEIIRRALGNRVTQESLSLAGIGYLRSDDRDAIPQAADFLLTEENVHTALVYGIVTGDQGEESVIGSLRTSKLTLDPDAFIKSVLGKSASGQYFGGGKLSAGGFEVPIEFLAGDHEPEYRERKWQVYDSQLKHKVFTKLGLERKPPSAPGAE